MTTEGSRQVFDLHQTVKHVVIFDGSARSFEIFFVLVIPGSPVSKHDCGMIKSFFYFSGYQAHYRLMYPRHIYDQDVFHHSSVSIRVVTVEDIQSGLKTFLCHFLSSVVQADQFFGEFFCF